VQLDEVSIGSWLTPAPQAVTPDQIDVWTSTVITITGENFITIPPGTLAIERPLVHLNNIPLTDVHWVNSTTLTATTPTLPLDIYDVVVTNPGGQASAVPHELIVGRRAYLPVVFR
jgi:hypothetical protein